MATFKTNLVGVGRSLSLMDLRTLAQNEPKNFIRKINICGFTWVHQF